MKLTDFVVKDAIITDMSVNAKDEAIRAMIKSLQGSGKISTENSESVITAILKREELGSTGIGNGVAVPHTKHPTVDGLVSTIALAKGGVDFASLDGELVYILFLLVSPPDRPGEHLRALETISRHLRNQDFCNFLKQSSTPEEVWELLLEADQKDG
ncbi:PTS sugar transporter subunit IIA [Lacunimicrobium album]